MSYMWLDGDCAQLCEAVRTGTSSDIQLLVETGVDVDAQDRNGSSGLHVAAYHGNSTLTQELLDAGANPNTQNQNGQTPLHFAAARGYDMVVLALLQGGVDVNMKTRYTEMAALHLASQNGHTDVVRLLLHYGANVEEQDAIFKTAEFYAANEEIAELLARHRLELEHERSAQQQQQLRLLDEERRRQEEEEHEARLHRKTASRPPVKLDQKIKFSKEHKKIMKMSVFDRLTRRKSQLLKE